jgi:hypothetical protein
MRLGDRLGVDSETLSQTYHTCLLFYVGCTATAAFQRMLGDEEFVADSIPIPSARTLAPDDWTPTPSQQCSRQPDNRSRGSSDRRG